MATWTRFATRTVGYPKTLETATSGSTLAGYARTNINGVGESWIEYYFEELQDSVEMRIMLFYKSTTSPRTLSVYENSKFYSQIQSSGETNDYETYYLDTDEIAELVLYLDDWESNPTMSLSIMKVRQYTK